MLPTRTCHRQKRTNRLRLQRRSLRSRWRLCRLTDAASPLRGLSALQAAGLVALRRPHTPCRGRRPRRPVGHCRFVQAFVKTGMDPVCHSEERSDAGISHYPAGSQESHRRNCNCLQEIATAPSGPRNDKLGGLAAQNVLQSLPTCKALATRKGHAANGCAVSAAAEAIGAAVLTIARASCWRVAGQGMPCPYNFI